MASYSVLQIFIASSCRCELVVLVGIIGETYVSGVDADGNAAPLLDFLRHGGDGLSMSLGVEDGEVLAHNGFLCQSVARTLKCLGASHEFAAECVPLFCRSSSEFVLT